MTQIFLSFPPLHFPVKNLTIPTHLSLFIYFSVHVSHQKGRIKRCNLSQNQAHNQHTGMRIYMIDMLKCTPTQLCLPIELLWERQRESLRWKLRRKHVYCHIWRAFWIVHERMEVWEVCLTSELETPKNNDIGWRDFCSHKTQHPWNSKKKFLFFALPRTNQTKSFHKTFFICYINLFIRWR